MSFKVLVFLPVILSYINGNPIKGGEDVEYNILEEPLGAKIQHEFQFMVHLKTYSKLDKGGNRIEMVNECGGIIISPDTILTAGHCLKCQKTKLVTSVHAGFIFYKDWKSAPFSWVKDYVVNEGYVERYNISDELTVHELSDIAIAWLETPFELGTTIQNINLNSFEGSLANLHGWIVGWGEVAPKTLPTTLQKAHMKVISNEECKKFYPQVLLPSDIICVMSITKSAAACIGDSGGPFVSGGIIYGISSFSYQSCRTDLPQIYTHVGMFYDWIMEKVEERRNKFQNSLKRQTSYEDSGAIDLSYKKRFKKGESSNSNQNEVL